MTINSGWLPTSQRPESGEDIWVAVLEWTGEHVHVDYAVCWDEVEGLMCQLNEESESNLWPPKNVLMWMPTNKPEFNYREAQMGRFEEWLDDARPRFSKNKITNQETGESVYEDSIVNLLFEAWFASEADRRRKK